MNALIKCHFLTLFYVVCEYGLILSTSDLLTLFYPFSSTFYVHWTACDNFWRKISILILHVGKVLTTSRTMPLSRIGCWYVLKTLCSFTWIWVLKIVEPICDFYCIVIRAMPNHYTLVSIAMKLDICCKTILCRIYMWNKTTRLCNLLIRRFYVYSK